MSEFGVRTDNMKFRNGEFQISDPKSEVSDRGGNECLLNVRSETRGFMLSVRFVTHAHAVVTALSKGAPLSDTSDFGSEI